MSAETAAEWLKERWVFFKRLGKGKDATDVFLVVQYDGTLIEDAEDDKEARTLVGFAAGKKKYTIGAVYEVETLRAQSKFRPGGARFLRMWPETERVARWQAAQKVRDIEIDAERREKSADNDKIAECMEPLRREYRKMIGTTRRMAFELAVLQYLRGMK
jgi:hypothetical protein